MKGFFDKIRVSTDEDEDKKPLKTVDEETETDEEREARERAELESKGDYADDDEPNSDNELEEDDDPFIATIDHLAEKGLLYIDEDKVYEEEGEELLEVVFEETLEKRYQEDYIDSIPEEYQSIFKHLKAGKPLNEWVDAVAPLDYSQVDLTDEDNQKALIEDHLALTGMDDEDIKEKVQEYEDAGTLEKNAKTALKYLKKNEEGKAKAYEAKLEREIAEREEKQEKELEDFRKDILSIEELGGFKLDKKTREKLADHITKPVNKKGESKLVVNQKSREKQLLVAYLDMIDFKFEDIKKSVESKVATGLRQKLNRFTDINANKNGGKSVKESKQSVKLPDGIWSSRREIEED